VTHQDVHDLAPEYVLGGLDEVTRMRVVAHLSECPSCRAEVASVSQVFDAVGRSVPDVEPPAALRDRIVRIPATAPAATSSPLWPMLYRVAAVAVLAVALWQWGVARREVSELRVRVAQLQVEAGQLLVARASIRDLESQVETMTHQVQVLRATDLVTYSLAAQAPAVGAHARAYVSHKDGMVFTAEGLPPLPAGKVYQLWVIVNAKPVSVGVFEPDATGRVHAVMDTPPIAVMPRTVAVTLEPTGGLAQPSGAVYLAGDALSQ
jgi:anti-sigma-K factor RskA